MGADIRLTVLAAVSSAGAAGKAGLFTLAQRLGVPAPVLLDGEGVSFARRWNELAIEVTGDPAILLASSELEARELRGALAAGGRPAEIAVDRGRFRGPAGALRDLAQHLGDTAACKGIVAVEASTAPVGMAAEAARLMVARWRACAPSRGAVAVDPDGSPIGVTAVSVQDTALIAAVGYQDLKEQFLPALHSAGRGAELLRFAGAAASLRSLERYLSVVATGRTTPFVDSTSTVSEAAVVRGPSLIGREVTVEDGAVVVDSVLMPGSRIGRGALVARSVVGPMARVGAGVYLVDDVAPAEGALA